MVDGNASRSSSGASVIERSWKSSEQFKSFVYVQHGRTVETWSPNSSLSSVEETVEVVSTLRFEVPDKARNILRVCHPYEKVYVVSLNNKADDFNRVELLGSGEGGPNKNIHESQRDKRKPLLSSKGDEVYLSGNEKSWITHAGVIGERGRELLKKSLAPVTRKSLAPVTKEPGTSDEKEPGTSDEGEQRVA